MQEGVMAGRLTTHVLDTTSGKPASGVKLALWSLSPSGERRLLSTAITNQDGRTDSPLISDGELKKGLYELVFSVGDYFDKEHMALPGISFLGDVPVRFGIDDESAHYHLPLLVSPWAYSTYRGS
jgi:5-hydroxyisourate hydrolase